MDRPLGGAWRCVGALQFIGQAEDEIVLLNDTRRWERRAQKFEKGNRTAGPDA